MDDQTELNWRMYAENCTQGRQHETMRATLTTLISAIAAGALGFVKLESPSCSQLPITALVIVLGLFGVLVSRKHYERYALHMRRASFYRRKIDDLVPGADLTATKRTADEIHNKQFSLFAKVSLAWLWSAMNIAVVFVGAVATWHIFRAAKCW
jgi:hypothetical protein